MPIHWQAATATHLKPLIHTTSFGLISDVDGTLSHIADNASQSTVSPRNRNLLSALTQQLPLVAAVSGRDAQTLNTLLGIPGMVYIGNHGLERWQDGRIKRHPEVAEYRLALQEARQKVEAQATEGVWVEDKLATLSIHYRQTPDPKAAEVGLKAQLQEITAQTGLEYFDGRMIFELRPPLQVNKGTAFNELVSEYELEAALFLGDDVSDVDAFNVARQLREQGQCSSWSVGVVSTETPAEVSEAADFTAEGVPDVEELLSWLLSERMASST